jgi:uncharacterized integral membrane protein (TIGR00698 family)
MVLPKVSNGFLVQIAPGLSFSCFVAALVLFITNQTASTLLDPLLMALLIGIAFRNIFPRATWHLVGTMFAARFILELSVMILGASIFLPSVMRAGIGLFAVIIIGVVGSMAIAFVVGHMFLKLSVNLSMLIGVSNSICGNAAAAVLAPIIGASFVELSSAIAIGSLLGAAQILLLPLLVPSLGLSEYHYGVVAGMSVYAVAQVYAAAAVVSHISVSVATFVKLVRVALLAPTIMVVQLFIVVKDARAPIKMGPIPWWEISIETPSLRLGSRIIGNFSLLQVLPWFVLGFLILATLRSVGVISQAVGDQIRDFATYLFLVSMVAIGSGVNIRDILKTGPKAILVICSVLLFLLSLSISASLFLPFS